MTVCPECGHAVSVRAVTCPSCGFPLQDHATQGVKMGHAPIALPQQRATPVQTSKPTNQTNNSPLIRIIGVVVSILVAIGVREGCASLRRSSQESEVRRVKESLDNGSLLNGVIEGVAQSPRDVWIKPRDREAMLRTFKATGLLSLREMLKEPVVIVARESDDGKTSIVEMEFSGLFADKIAVRGRSRTFLSDKGSTVVVSFADTKSFSSAKSIYARGEEMARTQALANPGVEVAKYLKIPGWELVEDQESRAAGAVMFVSSQGSKFAAVIATFMTPAQTAAQIKAFSTKPENREVMNQAVKQEIDKAAAR